MEDAAVLEVPKTSSRISVLLWLFAADVPAEAEEDAGGGEDKPNRSTEGAGAGATGSSAWESRLFTCECRGMNVRRL